MSVRIWQVLPLLFWGVSGAADTPLTPDELKRVPPTAPTEAIGTFRLRAGIQAQLVASEPLVIDPIAIAFDAFNRLYAVEMRDYSERAHERLGRIRLLEDVNNDGVMDRSSVFAEDLAWPTGVIPYDGGIFVIATPDLLFLKDADGDGRAEVRTTIFTGMGSTSRPLNVQQLANSMTWTIDNRIHVASGGNGGELRRADGKGPTLNLRFHDFSFDPRTLEARLETGGGQYGITFDSFGQKFICNNSSHIRQVMRDERYVARSMVTPPGEPVINIAIDGAAAPVFRTSPEEPWRVLRTSWRVAGVVPGPIEGGGRASGYFTSATGLLIYRGDALGEDFVGNAFVADCGSNLIHRKKLRANGIAFVAERAEDEQTSEFLTSNDVWFRPVQLANGPDGALYVVDMYREIIEHPWSLPKAIKDQVDLNSGSDRGRIFRVTSAKNVRKPLRELGKVTTRDLVPVLDSPNGWSRDTAARLLFERQDESVIPLLRKPFKTPEGRVLALYALHSMGALSVSEAIAALRDSDPRVRENALRIVESLEVTKDDVSKIASAAAELARDPAYRVRRQLLWSLTKLEMPNRWDILVTVLENTSDQWIRSAGSVAMSALIEEAPNLAGRELGPWAFREQMRIVGAGGKNVDRALTRLATLAETDRPLAVGGTAALLTSMDETTKARVAGLPEFSELLDASLSILKSPGARQSPELLDAITVVGASRHDETEARLWEWVHFTRDPELQRHALQTALVRSRKTAPSALWKAWPELAPQNRHRALDILLRTPTLTVSALRAIEAKHLDVTDFTASHRELVRRMAAPEVQALARKHFGESRPGQRAQELARVTPALSLKGNAAAGKPIYTERCSSCHKLNQEGQAVGPDLESVKPNGAAYILTHIVDPNREIAPRFLSHSLQLRTGETYSGMITEENAGSITLRDASGRSHSFAREFVHELAASGFSLMPEGLEEGLSQQQIADLLAHLLE